MTMNVHLSPLKNQTGVVLMVSLIMLLLLTLIGVTGSQITGFEEKMAGNSIDRNIAFQAAEAALAAAEAVVTSSPFDCTNGRYKAFDSDCNNVADVLPVWESNGCWSPGTIPLKSVAYTAGTLQGVLAAPRYIIETLPGFTCSNAASATCTGVGEKKYYHYRVTARALGGSDSSVVMLQSIFQSETAPP
jgi:type IV pilus assembly protein PilX